MDITEELPIFCYGTLRPGGTLADVWRRHGAYAVYDGEARLRGHVMSTNGPYPYITPGRGEVVGALIYPRSSDGYWDLIEEMDQIEGHPHHYRRGEVRVILPPRRLGVGVDAYAYIGHVRGRVPVPSGNWSLWRDRRPEAYGSDRRVLS